MIAEESRCLGPACQLYQDFVAFTVSTANQAECLPLLRFIMGVYGEEGGIERSCVERIMGVYGGERGIERGCVERIMVV